MLRLRYLQILLGDRSIGLSLFIYFMTDNASTAESKANQSIWWLLNSLYQDYGWFTALDKEDGFYGKGI